jgi:hypothetical protein
MRQGPVSTSNHDHGFQYDDAVSIKEQHVQSCTVEKLFGDFKQARSMGIYWSWANGYVAWHSRPEQYLTVTKGYNMARNLQSKLPSSDTLLIQDINVDATKRFMEEAKATSTGAIVRIANDARDASENSVSILSRRPCPNRTHHLYPT